MKTSFSMDRGPWSGMGWVFGEGMGQGPALREAIQSPNTTAHQTTLLGLDIHLSMQLLSALLSLAGIGLAGYFHWWDRQANEQVAGKVWPAVQFLRNKWYVDEIYDGLVVRPLRLLAEGLFSFDQLVLGGLMLAVGWLPGNVLGRLARNGQSGRLQGYGLGMTGGLAILAVIVFMAVYG